jgi:hypothetical protein
MQITVAQRIGNIPKTLVALSHNVIYTLTKIMTSYVNMVECAIIS